MWKDIQRFHKGHTGPEAGAKRKKGGADGYPARDLLSNAVVDILDVRRSGVFKHQDGAGWFVVEHHVCAMIAMNRVSWNIKSWDRVIEHRAVFM